jgi:hypothetical protein
MTAEAVRHRIPGKPTALAGKIPKGTRGREQRMIRRMAALCLALVFVGQATASVAAGHAKESTGPDAGARVGSVVGTAAYIPFKTAFCVLGGTGSGLAYLFAGGNAARKIAYQSCRGSWRITRGAVRGKEKVHFVG